MRDPLRELVGSLRWESRRFLTVYEGAYKRLARKDPCAYCGKYRRRMNWDHIVPLREGGSGTNNITRCCKKCNLKKAHTPLVVFLAEKHKKWWVLHKGGQMGSV